MLDLHDPVLRDRTDGKFGITGTDDPRRIFFHRTLSRFQLSPKKIIIGGKSSFDPAGLIHRMSF